MADMSGALRARSSSKFQIAAFWPVSFVTKCSGRSMPVLLLRMLLDRERNFRPELIRLFLLITADVLGFCLCYVSE